MLVFSLLYQFHRRYWLHFYYSKGTHQHLPRCTSFLATNLLSQLMALDRPLNKYLLGNFSHVSSPTKMKWQTVVVNETITTTKKKTKRKKPWISKNSKRIKGNTELLWCSAWPVLFCFWLSMQIWQSGFFFQMLHLQVSWLLMLASHGLKKNCIWWSDRSYSWKKTKRHINKSLGVNEY